MGAATSLPISRSQIDALGKRLTHARTVTDDDLRLLERVLGSYAGVLSVATKRLRQAVPEPELAMTSRVKTTPTLVQKLQREKAMSLKSMRDLAGIRLVKGMTRREQDELVSLVRTLFPADPRDVRTVDRRATPVMGYRAVHVVVSLAGLDIEIQVRTELQDLWANSFELLADRWGRDLRYGGELDEPDAVLWSGEDRETTRGDFLQDVLKVGQTIDRYERIVDEQPKIEAARREVVETITQAKRRKTPARVMFANRRRLQEIDKLAAVHDREVLDMYSDLTEQLLALRDMTTELV